MPRPAQPVAKMAVDVLYQNIPALSHPDAGIIKLVYFGHTSDGQKKITRQVSEAIVMNLESNGMHIVNGLTEAAQLLQRNGYAVTAPTDAVESVESLGDPGGEPVEVPDAES